MSNKELIKKAFKYLACTRWITILSLIVGMYILPLPVLAQPRIENTLKFGAVYFYMFNTSLSVINKNSGGEALNASNFSGGSLYIEKISNSFFGYEARGGLLQQQIDMTIDSIESTVQNTGISVAGSLRAYAQSHKRRGLNFSGAVNFGLLFSILDFQAAPPGLLNENYFFFTYVIGVEAGFDYLLRFAGIRAAVGYQYGEKNVVGDDSVDYKVRYNMGSLYGLVGVFSFF